MKKNVLFSKNARSYYEKYVHPIPNTKRILEFMLKKKIRANPITKIFIYHESNHHAVKSGYGRILDYYKGIKLPIEPEIIPYRFRSFISKTIFFNDNGYDTQSIEKEFQLYLKLRKINKNTLVHYLNGERDIRYLIKLYNNSNFIKFVATFHKPKSILHKIFKKNKTLKYLDGAIALGSNQAVFYKK